MAVSDKDQKEQGKTIQVGVGMLNQPTPQWMKYILRAVLYMSALWAILAPQLTHVNPDTLAEVNKWLLFGNAAISMTIKFFGWTYPQD